MTCGRGALLVDLRAGRGVRARQRHRVRTRHRLDGAAGTRGTSCASARRFSITSDELLQEHDGDLQVSLEAPQVAERAVVAIAPVLPRRGDGAIPDLTTEPLQLRAQLRARRAILVERGTAGADAPARGERHHASAPDVPPDHCAGHQAEMPPDLGGERDELLILPRDDMPGDSHTLLQGWGPERGGATPPVTHRGCTWPPKVAARSGQHKRARGSERQRRPLDHFGAAWG